MRKANIAMIVIALGMTACFMVGCVTAQAMLGVGLTPTEQLEMLEADMETVSAIFGIYDESPNAEKFAKFKEVFDVLKPSIEARLKLLERRMAALDTIEQERVTALSGSFTAMSDTKHVVLE